MKVMIARRTTLLTTRRHFSKSAKNGEALRRRVPVFSDPLLRQNDQISQNGEFPQRNGRSPKNTSLFSILVSSFLMVLVFV
jgi:hypothetical protein